MDPTPPVLSTGEYGPTFFVLSGSVGFSVYSMWTNVGFVKYVFSTRHFVKSTCGWLSAFHISSRLGKPPGHSLGLVPLCRKKLYRTMVVAPTRRPMYGMTWSGANIKIVQSSGGTSV